MRRYIGTTDESLCQQGIDLLKNRNYPNVEQVFSSPLKRCLETAALIYPGQEPIVIKNLAECDFGEFENKNADELGDNPKYQAWIDSGGRRPFPGGESRQAFEKRSVDSFLEIVDICQKNGIECASLVVHGGTIMSVMSHFVPDGGDYYFWQCGNGEGYELILSENTKSCLEYISVGKNENMDENKLQRECLTCISWKKVVQ